jgi:23S rRNA U2552 (ribose-2'-O)-methylase RlmE/FtsJ
MSYYILPNSNYHNILNKINVSFTDKDIIGASNSMLNNYINKIKLLINTYSDRWDNFKKITNPYEYIHTVVPNAKNAVCRYKPLSRSFFKMIELSAIHSLINELPDNCKTFHLAEGPGGFIEATLLLRDNPDDIYYGMTLIDNDNINIPGWRKSHNFIKNNPNVIIETGKDNTGNIMNVENLIHCYDKYRGTMDLITADGGFDFSIDFNQQEIMSSKLIFAQICFAISMQKIGGNFILKVFDLFTQSSIDMIFLLCCVYKQVYITKPNTSRYANSEKYIVCKDFILNNADVAAFITSIIPAYYQIESDSKLERVLNCNIPYLFTSKLEELNSIFGQQQIENIASTINLIENNRNDKIDNLKKANINKCMIWCQKYNLPYNNLQPTNIFLSGGRLSDEDM